MISVRTDIAVLIKMNVCPTTDMDRVRSELSLSYLPPDKVKVMLECVLQDKCTNMDGYYHCSCPGRPGTRLSSDRHSCEEIDMCEQDNGGCSHTCTSTHGQVNFFQLVLGVFLYMKEPLRHPYISDQVYCSCPTGEQLGDDWKTCRAPPQCPEVHTEIVFPDLQHFFPISRTPI